MQIIFSLTSVIRLKPYPMQCEWQNTDSQSFRECWATRCITSNKSLCLSSLSYITDFFPTLALLSKLGMLHPTLSFNFARAWKILLFTVQGMKWNERGHRYLEAGFVWIVHISNYVLYRGNVGSETSKTPWNSKKFSQLCFYVKATRFSRYWK